MSEESPATNPIVLLRVAAFPFESLEAPGAGSSLERLRELLLLEEALEAETGEIAEALHRVAGPPIAGEPERSRRRLAVIALRRAVHNRRPLEPALLAEADPLLGPTLRERLEHQRERDRRLQALRSGYEEAFAADRRAARGALVALTRTPLFREGIRLASRSLFRALDGLLSTHPDEWGHDDRHVAWKCASYAARATAKTSPQSVFCATALVRLSPAAARVSGTNDLVRRDILLNVYEARKVTACLGAEPALRAAARLVTNPTLREADGAWTWWRPATLARAEDDEVLSRVRDLPVLRMFMEEAADATRGVAEVLRAVAERSGADASDLARFLDDLVERGILLWEPEIPYNCRRPLLALTRACRAAGCTSPRLVEAEGIERQVDLLPGLGDEERIASLDRIQERLERLPHVRALKEDEIFRLDAASGLDVALPASILEEVREAVDWYARLFASLYPEKHLRAGYVERFLQAHPPDRDVALLDLYHGPFEPEPRRRPVSFPEPSGASEDAAARSRFLRARSAFVRFASQAEAEGVDEVALTREDWGEILGDAPVPPWFCGVLFQVDAGSAEAVAAGRARIALNALFSGSGLASARLDHLHGGGGSASGPIARDVRRGWGRLERRRAILAEVTYMHWGRTANAGLRPSIFEYEIELPGEKASEGARVIPLRELAVRYDTAARHFVMRWLPRGLEVIPIVGSGISPEGFVSFLVSLGQQGFQPLTLFPGFEAAGIVAWPRFTWGRTVLFRRRWVVPGDDLPPGLVDPSAPDSEVFAALARLRRRHRLPRHVFVHTSADPKPFHADLESPVLADLVHRAAAPRAALPAPSLTFTEMLPSPEGLWVRDGRGRYASEFLAQLHGPVDRPPGSPRE